MKVEKTYSDVEGQPDLIECDICQDRMRRHPRWVITNHNRRKHGLGRFLCGLCDYKGRFGHELINHMAEDHAADDPIVKCPCCQLELNFGRALQGVQDSAIGRQSWRMTGSRT